MQLGLTAVSSVIQVPCCRTVLYIHTYLRQRHRLDSGVNIFTALASQPPRRLVIVQWPLMTKGLLLGVGPVLFIRARPHLGANDRPVISQQRKIGCTLDVRANMKFPLLAIGVSGGVLVMDPRAWAWVEAAEAGPTQNLGGGS